MIGDEQPKEEHEMFHAVQLNGLSIFAAWCLSRAHKVVKKRLLGRNRIANYPSKIQ